MRCARGAFWTKIYKIAANYSLPGSKKGRQTSGLLMTALRAEQRRHTASNTVILNIVACIFILSKKGKQT